MSERKPDGCEADDQSASSKISLRVTSEHIDLHNRSSYTLASISTNNDNQLSNIHYVIPPSPSREINNDITILFTQANFNPNSMQSVARDGYKIIYEESISENTADKNDEVKPVPPPYSETELRNVLEPPEFEVNITPPPYPPLVLYSAPPLQGAPPTYSAIMRIGPIDVQPRRSVRLFGRREIRIQPSPPFIAPVPPPCYGEVQGVCTGRPLIPQSYIDIHDSAWGFAPMSVMCPMCNNFVITNIHTRRSNVTHFSALALCICGCWPCCLLPYCIKSCKTTYHECPVCFSIIGVYNPW